MASLDTTAQIITALGKAEAAAARIRSGLGPVAHSELVLSELPSAYAQRPGHDSHVGCEELEISACGTWLAVIKWTQHGPCQDDACSEVAICRTAGMIPHMSFACGAGTCSIHWAPDCQGQCPHLSIALSPFPLDTRSRVAAAGIPAAVIIDAQTGAMLSSLSTGTVASAHAQALLRDEAWYVYWGSGDSVAWSPCGTKLLVAQQLPDIVPNNHTGWLSLYNVVHDELVLETEYCDSPWRAVFAWHPGSAGIVMAATGRLKDAGAFTRAGIALGVLPAPCEVAWSEGLGFSADAQRYLARDGRYDSYWILSCMLKGLDIFFQVEHRVQAYSLHQVPHSSLAITNLDQSDCRTGLSMLRSLCCDEPGLCLGHNAPGQAALRGPLCFSPSGQLVSDSEGLPRIFCLKTGALLWRMVAGQDSLPFEQERAAAPTLCKRTHWWCKGWLPSGLGVVYEAHQEKPESSIVHVCMLAE